MRILLRSVVLACLGLGASVGAQPTSSSPLAPPPNGPRQADPTWHAIVGATLHVTPEETIEDATIVFRNGRITSVGQGAAPEGARVWDGEGLHVYPGLIEPFLEIDAPAPQADASGVHWNDKVVPQRRATDGAGPGRDADTLRKMGFVAAAISPRGGLIRGQAGVVSLAEAPGDESAGDPPVYADGVYQSVSFSSGRGFGGGYPNSQMGAIALIRQCLSDADWQAVMRDEGEAIEPNALDALESGRPLVFETRDELEALRAAKIAREFGRDAIILGNGNEYKRLDAIVEDGLPVLLPLEFPDAPDVASLGAEDDVELGTLMHWEQAPYNPRRLDEAGVTVAITTTGMRNRGKLLDQIRAAIERGLPEAHALAMLTTTPAELLGVEDQLGTLDAGKVASIVVTDGPIFEKKTKVRDVWIDGRRHEINAAPDEDITGRFQVTFVMPEGVDEAAARGPILVIGTGDSVTLEDPAGEEDAIKARKVQRIGNRLTYVVDDAEAQTSTLVSAVIEGDEIVGTLRMAGGETLDWFATRVADEPASEPEDAEAPGEGGPRAEGPGDPIVGHWDMIAIHEQMFGPDGVPFTLDIARDEDGELVVDFASEPVVGEVTDAAFEDGLLTGLLTDSATGSRYRMSIAMTGDAATGESVFLEDETRVDIRGTRRREGAGGGARASRETSDEDLTEMPDLPGYPFGPYALPEAPAQRVVAFVNATVWTSGPAGIIENGWVVVADGRIAGVGEGDLEITDDEVEVVDCEGMHITPGIIDCHSHTGISRGINESGQAVTAEVRIADVTNPDSINWYRQLAGGVTAVNNLHGSANPIGGQNQVNKIRWGCERPDDMHMEGAPSGIKFALGENVKQSNWSNAGDRYPQTRMGVETLIRDRFIAASEYADAIAAGEDVRRDLELEALAEILAGERLVHCHSYRQDEILMLCRVADEFGFTIGSFQHVLEGYKVAEAIKENALGGSCFSDWWAYKVEVQDAIPYNGAIMHDVGVVVSFNSDSDELARRLNTEAAKAVRYGGLSPEEALKFVTINPAIQLGIDDEVGSIEEGKSADLAIWSGDPLSTFSICEATWIDGREYFSLERDAELRARDGAERRRLIQKVLADGRAKPKGESGPTDEPEPRDPADVVDTPPQGLEWAADALREQNLELLRRGIDPDTHRCGECGVTLSDLLENNR